MTLYYFQRPRPRSDVGTGPGGRCRIRSVTLDSWGVVVGGRFTVTSERDPGPGPGREDSWRTGPGVRGRSRRTVPTSERHRGPERGTRERSRRWLCRGDRSTIEDLVREPGQTTVDWSLRIRTLGPDHETRDPTSSLDYGPSFLEQRNRKDRGTGPGFDSLGWRGTESSVGVHETDNRDLLRRLWGLLIHRGTPDTPNRTTHLLDIHKRRRRLWGRV